MNKSISRRAQFQTPHEGIDNFVAKARNRHPYRPHTIALLVMDFGFSSLVVGHPSKPRNKNEPCPPVPVQQRLTSQDPRITGEKLAKVILRGAVKSEQIQYLGYGYGDHHSGGACIPYGKYVHWFGVQAPSRVRSQGNQGLASEVSNLANEEEAEVDFQCLRWLDFQRWLALGQGNALSQAKTRMVLQATLLLSERSGVNNSTVACVHKELSAMDVLPKSTSA